MVGGRKIEGMEDWRGEGLEEWRIGGVEGCKVGGLIEKN